MDGSRWGLCRNLDDDDANKFMLKQRNQMIVALKIVEITRQERLKFACAKCRSAIF